jgi:aminoglycoside phosphotransferase family enzyme/predicted kinase
MSNNIAQALIESGFADIDDEKELIETHISWVILAGRYAYKIKKPVDLGFVDFTTLKKRKFYCDEEVRLNRRLAPELYIGVIKITGTADCPILEGVGAALEYAVKMKRFSEQKELRHMLATALPDSQRFQQLATDLAAFHEAAGVADLNSGYATLESLTCSEIDNFTEIRKHIHEPSLLLRMEHLEAWTRASLVKLEPLFWRRRSEGRIRECHGDLHLGNLVCFDDRIVPFDCLEFNSELRWIDVASEIAFLLMDLIFNRQYPLARQLLDRYLEASGDYEIVILLDHYLVYRAMVRAKVSCLQPPAKHPTPDPQGEFVRYIELAERFSAPKRTPRLIITCGLSGSGKTWISGLLVELSDTIRIRSDVVRKHHYGLTATGDSHSELGAGIYTAAATNTVYNELSRFTEIILDAGYSVVVDATFLDESRRAEFSAIAEKKTVPFTILVVEAPYEILVSRISTRQKSGADASEADLAVLDNQRRRFEPLSPVELEHAVIIDSATDRNHLIKQLQPLING